MSDIYAILQKTILFKNFNITEVKDLLKNIQLNQKKYKKDEIILMQNDKYDVLHIILKGICIGEMMDISGKVIRVEELAAPELIAAGILFSKDNYLPVIVKTKTPVEMLFINKKDILNLCKKSDRFLINYLEEISDRVSFLSKRLFFMSFKSIKSKIAHYFLTQAQGKEKFLLKLTIEELASFFGIERPSLSRAFQQMEQEGIIKKDKKEIKILEKEKLTRMAE